MDHHGYDRDRDHQVLAGLAVHLPAHAVLAALCAEDPLVAEIDQRFEVLVFHDPDAAAIATIAALGTTGRDGLLAAKAAAAVASVPAPDLALAFHHVSPGLTFSLCCFGCTF